MLLAQAACPPALSTPRNSHSTGAAQLLIGTHRAAEGRAPRSAAAPLPAPEHRRNSCPRAERPCAGTPSWFLTVSRCEARCWLAAAGQPSTISRKLRRNRAGARCLSIGDRQRAVSARAATAGGARARSGARRLRHRSPGRRLDARADVLSADAWGRAWTSPRLDRDDPPGPIRAQLRRHLPRGKAKRGRRWARDRKNRITDEVDVAARSETANGRIRRWLPRTTDRDAMTDADIQAIAMLRFVRERTDRRRPGSRAIVAENHADRTRCCRGAVSPR